MFSELTVSNIYTNARVYVVEHAQLLEFLVYGKITVSNAKVNGEEHAHRY